MEGKRKRAAIRNRQNAFDYIGVVAKYILIVLLIMYMASMAKRAYSLGYEIFCQKSMDQPGFGHEVVVEIPGGTSVKGIANLLKKSGLIEDADIFYYQERLSSDHGKITPGTYSLSTEMTPDEIISVLTENYVEEKTEEGSGEQKEGQ